jgi:hypothetical protein
MYFPVFGIIIEKHAGKMLFEVLITPLAHECAKGWVYTSVLKFAFTFLKGTIQTSHLEISTTKCHSLNAMLSNS